MPAFLEMFWLFLGEFVPKICEIIPSGPRGAAGRVRSLRLGGPGKSSADKVEPGRLNRATLFCSQRASSPASSTLSSFVGRVGLTKADSGRGSEITEPSSGVH